MPVIFPGMDPYLEAAKIFPGIHGPMIIDMRDKISAGIRPRYIASVGERVYVESQTGGSSNRIDRAMIPDV